MITKQILTDQRIEKAFEGTNFGYDWDGLFYGMNGRLEENRRRAIIKGLLKVACGYWNDEEIEKALKKLELVDIDSNELSRKGKAVLYEEIINDY